MKRPHPTVPVGIKPTPTLAKGSEDSRLTGTVHGGGAPRGGDSASRARRPFPDGVSEIPGLSSPLPRPPLRLAGSSGAAAIGRPPSPPPAARPPRTALAARGTGSARRGPGVPAAPAALSRHQAALCAALGAPLRRLLGGPLRLEGQALPPRQPWRCALLRPGPAGWDSPRCGLGAGRSFRIPAPASECRGHRPQLPSQTHAAGWLRVAAAGEGLRGAWTPDLGSVRCIRPQRLLRSRAAWGSWPGCGEGGVEGSVRPARGPASPACSLRGPAGVQVFAERAGGRAGGAWSCC